MSFKCKKCGYCCKNGIIVIYPEDISRISTYLGIQDKEFVEEYCHITKIHINETTNLDVYYLDNSTRCIFLSKNNLCGINPVKPLQCKLGPEAYFNSIGTWRNCIQYRDQLVNPFSNEGLSDEFFIRKLLEGYSFEK